MLIDTTRYSLSHSAALRASVSLRLGHARVLTCPRHVIHCARAVPLRSTTSRREPMVTEHPERWAEAGGTVRQQPLPSPVGEGGPPQRWMRSSCRKTPHPSLRYAPCHLPPLGKAKITEHPRGRGNPSPTVGMRFTTVGEGFPLPHQCKCNFQVSCTNTNATSPCQFATPPAITPARTRYQKILCCIFRHNVI